MSAFIANARMYSVTPEIEAAWRELLAHIAGAAGVTLDYMPYPAPAPLETLWSRGDLGCVFMCGFPIALKLADVVPVAAPVPAREWAGGRPVYRSDFIVRGDSPFRTLEQTFGGSFGWTVAHSHSGFNAPRHHLLAWRTPAHPKLYHEVVANLITARAILDAVVTGRIDTGPLDSYWHALLARHKPELVKDIRVVATTALAPIPAFVASPALGAPAIDRLRASFAAAAKAEWFAGLGEKLMISGFAPVTESDFALTLDWDREARKAGYLEPG